MADIPIFDKAGALDRVDQDIELLTELVEILRKEGGETLEKLKLAVDKGDAAEINRCSHSLKSALGNVGAAAAHEIAFQLEKGGKSGDVSAARALFAALLIKLDAFYKAFEEFLQIGT